jgi:hypothetical protein
VTLALKPSLTSALHPQAVNKYQRLAAVLRGEQPRGMLPPAPRGYVAARTRELAGTAVVHCHRTYSILVKRLCTNELATAMKVNSQ